MDLAIKKTLFAKEQNRPDVQLKRKRWRSFQKKWDPKKLVFIDETGINTKMARLYGRSLQADRCVDYIPHGHWHTNTFIAGLRYDHISAPILFDGPMNAETFLAYVTEVLGPTLNVGDIVICDNLSSHKASGVKEAIEKRGASIEYLPAYSPDLNPIEMAFSKIKARFKKDRPESFEDIIKTMKNALLSFDHNDCSKLFHHAQYATN